MAPGRYFGAAMSPLSKDGGDDSIEGAGHMDDVMLRAELLW
jgi:hypothetical protein